MTCLRMCSGMCTCSCVYKDNDEPYHRMCGYDREKERDGYKLKSEREIITETKRYTDCV